MEFAVSRSIIKCPLLRKAREEAVNGESEIPSLLRLQCRYLKCVGKRENKSHMATVAQNTHPPSLSLQSIPLPAEGRRERTLMKVLLVIEANSGVAAKEEGGGGGAAVAVDTPSPPLFYATFLLWLLLGPCMTRRV